MKMQYKFHTQRNLKITMIAICSYFPNRYVKTHTYSNILKKVPTQSQKTAKHIKMHTNRDECKLVKALTHLCLVLFSLRKILNSRKYDFYHFVINMIIYCHCSVWSLSMVDYHYFRIIQLHIGIKNIPIMLYIVLGQQQCTSF